MCGIIISSIDFDESCFKNIQKRGPDYTNIVEYNNLKFVHFLLHLTGEKTVQPLIKDGTVCIFNGEIYNYKNIMNDAKSDSYSIIHAYEKYGDEFVKYLDGEFVIVLIDFNNNKLFIASDIFKTKPLFYNIDEEIVISSYESTCKSIKNQKYEKIKPNEVLVFDLITKNIIKQYSVYDFDLTQKKSNYDDYIEAFENAVLKRYPENSIPMVTLSSGLDSGSIACCLKKYNKDALFLSVLKNEDYDTMIKRKKILNDSHVFLELSDDEKEKYKKDLTNGCEPFVWDWNYHIRLTHIDNGFDMGSILAKSKMIDFSKNHDKGIRVLFSGIGADEVMARNQYYSNGWGNVDEFPDNLKTIFPWANFFNGSMENYLKGDEYVGGFYGYETRYPFCDKNVVQEFLWLEPHLKNNYNGSIYKPPLMYYLDKEKFPYYNKKLGFNC
jgi:asparagine synthetase B (glutamine-hydrolysing)